MSHHSPSSQTTKRRRAFPSAKSLHGATSTTTYEEDFFIPFKEGDEYFIPVKTDPHSPTQQLYAPRNTMPLNPQYHADPDTFAVFTAAEGSTFGHSVSYNFLKGMDDPQITSEEKQHETGEEYVDMQLDSSTAGKMKTSDSFDSQKMGDIAMQALSHPLATSVEHKSKGGELKHTVWEGQ
eukprot:scaffold178861_cov55-Attheya_sp.AAC.3